MTRRTRIALGIAAAVLAGGGAFAAWVYPWYSMPAPPEEVVKEWRKVEQWADAAHGMHDPAALRATIALLPLSDELRSLLQVDGPKFPELALETLEAGPRSAVEALERWHRSAAPGGDRCDAVCPRAELSCRTMNLLYLGRLALATSHGPEPELRVEVALHLAQTLRASGNLVEAVIGFRLASEAMQWAQARGAPSRTLFDRYQPTSAEIFPALAREAWCCMQFAEDTIRSTPAGPLGFSPWPRSITDKHRPPFSIIRIERELAVAKLWQAKRLSSAAAQGDDFEAQANALEQHELQESLDRTALALVVAVPYASQVRDFAKRVEEYHAWQPAGGAP